MTTPACQQGWKLVSIAIVMMMCLVAAPGIAVTTDALAQSLLDKAGLNATICEMPRVGDGALAAVLAKISGMQVHALAANDAAAAVARKPALDAGVLGTRVTIEVGKTTELPLGDWVADLMLIVDATNANLPSVPASEAVRVLSPYRGTLVIGNPGGTQAGLSKESMLAWCKGTGGAVTLCEDAGGLWAVVKMPNLLGGDDWGQLFHAANGNPVSQDTDFLGKTYQLQWTDLPLQGERNYTIVASAGRYFMVTCAMRDQGWHEQLNPQHPYELEARGLYNGRFLWRRPVSAYFGDLSLTLVATPQRVYIKDDGDLLVLDPETGHLLKRLPATREPDTIRWMGLSAGVLVAVTGPKQFLDHYDDPPKNAGESAHDYNTRRVQLRWSRQACRELVAWDTTMEKELWRRKIENIDPTKVSIYANKLFLYANEASAYGLSLRTGDVLWQTPAPAQLWPINVDLSPDLAMLMAYSNGGVAAMSTADLYVIYDPTHDQRQFFSAKDGRLLWEDKRGYQPMYAYEHPFIVGKTLFDRQSRQLDLTTFKPANVYPKIQWVQGESFKGCDAFCGHPIALESGLWLGGGIYDMTTGTQLMRRISKAACNTGNLICDGVELQHPGACYCGNWRGVFAVRPAPERPARVSDRWEQVDAAPVNAQADARDWTTYRGDDHRKGSSAASVPAQATIRWISTPKSQVVNALPAFVATDRSTSPPAAVGALLWLGTIEGAVVCLNKDSGAEVWRYWTAGAIRTTPSWDAGRLYVGSEDGWVYCLDAATGRLCWRYRVAPDDRRIDVLGGLSSAWPVWANVLVHEGTVYAAAGIRYHLGGTVLCALDARSGTPKWEKDFRMPPVDARGTLPVAAIPSGGGQLAWYDGKLWWNGTECGLWVVDPATGAARQYTDMDTCRNLSSSDGEVSGLYGQDIGILPGGWVACGGFPMVRGASEFTGWSGTLKLNILVHTGPDGLPSAKTAPLTPEAFPRILSYEDFNRPTRVNRQIPIWDDQDAILPGNFVNKGGETPVLCHQVGDALNAEIAAHPLGDAAMKKAIANCKWGGIGGFIQSFVATSLTVDGRHELLPDVLVQAVNHRQFSPSGMMLLAKNAVVLTGSEDGKWRALAVNRTDRNLLWTVGLPSEPAWNGMSMARDGEVLIPLRDGRLVCVGEARETPLPAAAGPGSLPGWSAASYISDAVAAGFKGWTPADFAILHPADRFILNDASYHSPVDEKSVIHVLGYIDIPRTGTYHFSCAADSATFTLYDATGQYVEASAAGQKISDNVLLEQGKHPMSLVVLQDGRGKNVAVQWSHDGQTSLIPASALCHVADDISSERSSR